ncbi:GntR family transcriptional regulator [Pleomorphochaeta sp. DL1XJH-081]|jgi:DNA-binding transcriptional regulator YhcF (GntR family)|uniref:GntR family transcriptional regulator n=1 Tax=Pleomorphochaeta sp. DL1XJH-081 TaxID=3409690 RepID=UPI003BB52A82
MQFDKHTSIYLQIAEYLYDRILSGEWPDGQRIPSIRDMAVQLEVNPNTVTRTYTLLQEEGTLENQRGIGYFTAADARQKVLDQKREAFVRNELPAIFATMEQVGLTKNDLIDQFETYQKEQKQS